MKVKNRLKKIIGNFKNRQGISTLLLTFFITFLLSMVAFVLLLISVLSAKRANQVRYSQTSFSAAEGALHETIQHLRNDPDWPDSLPDATEYTIGEADNRAEIERTITELEDGTLRIDISADSSGVKRRLIATFTRGGEGEKIPLDIILAIDHSESMGWEDDEGKSAMEYAKDAADSFIDVIEKENKNIDNEKDKIGLISYNHYVSGTGNWQQLIKTFTVPADTTSLDIEFMVNADSEDKYAWVDDFRLVNGENLVLNPGFESGDAGWWTWPSSDGFGVVDGGHSGNKSFQVATKYASGEGWETNVGVVAQTLPSGFSTGEELTASFWYKTGEGITSASLNGHYTANGVRNNLFSNWGNLTSGSLPLTDEYSEVADEIKLIPSSPSSGGTNIGEAVAKSIEELNDNGRADAAKVIILFSDGIPQFSSDNCSSCGPQCDPGPLCWCAECVSDVCLAEDYGDPVSHPLNYSPTDDYENSQGNCCTQEPLTFADGAKGDGVIIFSVYLSTYTSSVDANADPDCVTALGSKQAALQSIATLGRLILLRASSESSSQTLPDEDDEPYTYYKETGDPSELEDIYEEIAAFISSSEFFEYQEGLPEPD